MNDCYSSCPMKLLMLKAIRPRMLHQLSDSSYTTATSARADLWELPPVI